MNEQIETAMERAARISDSTHQGHVKCQHLNTEWIPDGPYAGCEDGRWRCLDCEAEKQKAYRPILELWEDRPLREPERKLNTMKLADIAENLDLTIISDLCGDDENNTWPVFYLGQPPELSAGLRGFSASPSFNTEDELETWANEHYQELYKEFIVPFLEGPESKFVANIQDIIGVLVLAEAEVVEIQQGGGNLPQLAIFLYNARRKLVALANEEGSK